MPYPHIAQSEPLILPEGHGNIHVAQTSAIEHIAISQRHQETATRAYFDWTFTSTAADLNHRTIPKSEFDKIVASVTAGVRVLDSHKHNNNGLGKTLDAMINGDKIDGSFYILKGEMDGETLIPMELDDMSYPTTRSWIMGIKDGMIDKCSMGWYSERDLCNLCGESIYSYKCPHYPGNRYPITNEETGEETLQTCTYSCFGITVVEVSLVYFGANPDSRLAAKAKAMVESFTSEEIDRIESHLKVAIANPNRRIFDMPFSKEDKNEIATIIGDAVKPLADQITELQKTEPAPQPPTIQTAAPGVPVIKEDGAYNITDANGNVIAQVAGKDIPKPPQPLNEEQMATAMTTAMETAMKPVTEALGKVETALKTGDTLDEREKAVAEWKKQYKRANGTDPTDEEIEALETYPDVAAIQVVSKAFKATADKMFKSGRSTEGLGEELESGGGEGGNEGEEHTASPSNPM